MGIELKTHKMLWGRSGNRCAMSDCKIELVMDISETDDESLIGEECHIIAKKPSGPRGDKNFDKDKLNKYSNLVLMCRNHHKIIDDNPDTYTIKIFNQLDELREWLFTRIYSNRYLELESAFENFRLVLQDFLNLFKEHAKKSGEWYDTEKFYKLKWHDEQNTYDRLTKQYTFHVLLVEDLVLELTRAVNHICSIVRRYIDTTFRLKEGLTMVEIGPFMNFEYRQYKPQYTNENLEKDFLYKNLEVFKEDRINRDQCRSVGTDSNDPRFLKS